MHEAFFPIVVFADFPKTVKCITCYGNILLVGTQDGNLLRYRVEPNNFADFETNKKNDFGGKPVTQLKAIPELDTLLSLSDGNILMHRLQALQYVQVISRARGATLFEADVHPKTGEVRLCVAVKRKLLLLKWSHGDWIELRKEMSLSHIPRLIRWVKDCVLVFCDKYYTLIYLTSGRIKELCQLSAKHDEPVAVSVRNEKQELLGMLLEEGLTFVAVHGHSTVDLKIRWTDTLVSVEWVPPYLVGVVSKYVEVRSIWPQDYHQTLELVSESRLRMSCKHGDALYVASEKAIWRLVPHSRVSQITALIASKSFELAIRLADGLDPSEKGAADINLPDIKVLYAFNLFCQRRFKEAFDLFRKVNTCPSNVVGLFPGMLPPKFKNLVYYPGNVPELNPDELDKGLLALIEYLTDERQRLKNPLVYEAEEAVENSSGKMVLVAAPRRTGARRDKRTPPVTYRPIKEGSWMPPNRNTLKEIVDTSLLICLIKEKPSLVMSLVRQSNCSLFQATMELRKAGLFNELIQLFEVRGEHRQALELMKSDSLRASSQSYASPEKIIKYLQRRGGDFQDLIFEFGEWVLQQKGADALCLFTDPPELDVKPLDEKKTLLYLDRKFPALVIPYLEHVVNTVDSTATDTDPAYFHNYLANVYRIHVQKLYSEYLNSLPEGHEPAPAGKEPGELGQLRDKLIDFLASSKYYDPELVLNQYPLDRFYEERALLLGRKGRYDQALALYVHVLGDWHRAEKYCKTVYDAAQREEQIAEHDVFFELLKVYLDPPEPRELKDVLPSNYSGGIFKPYPNQGADILKKYGHRIDPARALPLLPDETNLNELRGYITKAMERNAQAKRSAQIRRALLQQENHKVRAELTRSQSVKILIEESTECSLCKKKIGHSAFGRSPTGRLLHYGCLQLDREEQRQFPLLTN